MSCRRWTVLTALFAAMQPVEATAQHLIALDGPVMYEFKSGVYAMSPDGSVVSGVQLIGGELRGFLWGSDGSPIGDLAPDRPLPHHQLAPYGVSSLGRAVVGMENKGHFEAFRWTPELGYQGLGFLPSSQQSSIATGVSADGRTVVGYSISSVMLPNLGNAVVDSEEAFIWTPEGGMVGLGFIPGANWPVSRALAVSGDGSAVTGSTRTPLGADDRREAFHWTHSTGMVPLGVLPGMGWSDAIAMSLDGSAIFGSSGGVIDDLYHVEKGFRWTAHTGMEELQPAPGFDSFSPLSSSGDGEIAVGFLRSHDIHSIAAIWTSETGARPLIDVFTELGVTGLSGWNLGIARSISADGRTIAGSGQSPDGFYQGWVVTIPSSGTGSVVIMGALYGLRRRREAWDPTTNRDARGVARGLPRRAFHPPAALPRLDSPARLACGRSAL